MIEDFLYLYEQKRIPKLSTNYALGYTEHLVDGKIVMEIYDGPLQEFRKCADDIATLSSMTPGFWRTFK